MAIREAALSPESAELAECRSWIGAAQAAQNKIDEARPLLETGYEGMRKAKGEQHSETRKAYVRLMAVQSKPDNP
jgi:hypothetical protein